MKKLFAALVIFSVLGHAAFAAIGYIEVQKVFKEYKETKKAQDELGKKEETFKKEFEDSQKKLQQAEKSGKKADELEKMRKEMETQLAPKRDTLLKLNEQLTVKLQREILTSVEKIAKKVGVDMVLDKQVIITGGMDLTDMVINDLNK